MVQGQTKAQEKGTTYQEWVEWLHLDASPRVAIEVTAQGPYPNYFNSKLMMVLHPVLGTLLHGRCKCQNREHNLFEHDKLSMVSSNDREEPAVSYK